MSSSRDAQIRPQTENAHEMDITNLAVEVERTRVARAWSVLETLLPLDEDGDSLLDALRSVFWASWALATGVESLGLR